jgi:glycosyltransferase involved in cell wall biosynthesis
MKKNTNIGNMNKVIRTSTVSSSLYKLLEGQLKYLNTYYNVLAVSSASKDLEIVEAREGVKVIPIEMERKISPFQDLISLWKLYQLFKKEKPLIIHSITPKSGLLTMLAGFFASVPIRIHTVTGLPLMEATGLKRSILNTVEKITYSCATKIYPNSKGLYDFILKERFAKASQLKLLANGSTNGIDIQHFNPSQISLESKTELKKALGIKETDFVFVFVGRLVMDKGINELIAAFKQLKNTKQLTAKLLLVGPFEKKTDPLKMATMLEIKENPNVISVGAQVDVRPYFMISNVLVFPSYREGFPNVVMQAGAMNLASIVSNINGCNEIIQQEKNGWIIPVKNSEAIFKAMKNCLKNTKELKKFSENSRNLIVCRYQQKVVWEAILNEYKILEKNA